MQSRFGKEIRVASLNFVPLLRFLEARLAKFSKLQLSHQNPILSDSILSIQLLFLPAGFSLSKVQVAVPMLSYNSQAESS